MSPRTAPGAAGEGPLDRRMLAEIREVGGEPLLREMLEMFAERTPERLRAVARAAAAGDLEAAAGALHSLRSAAGTVGAGRLVELAGELERRARAGDAQLARGLKQLHREAAAAVAAAESYGATKV